MANKSFPDFENNPDTVLTNPAPTDLVLLWDRSEPLDINKVKVISYQNLVNLAAQAAVQALVSGQAAGDMFYASSATALARKAKGTAGQVLKMNSGATAPEWGLAGGLMVASQAAGDVFYASSGTALARLAKGTAGQVLKMNSGATAPEWGTNKELSCYGLINAGSVFGGTATSWTDISLATVNIIVPKTTTLFAIAVGLSSMTSVGYGEIRWMLDNTEQRAAHTGSTNPPMEDSFSILGLKTGVTAGTKTCKLQYQVSSGDTLSVNYIFGFILGFAE